MTHEPDGPVTPPANGEAAEGETPEASPGASTPDAGAPETATAEAPDDSGVVSAADLPPEEEPTTTGTIFIMILFLMALAGMWGLMYLTLLSR